MPTAPVAFSWADWSPHLSIVLGSLLLEALYLLGVGPLRQRFAWADRVKLSQVASFSLGVLVFFLAEGSPLHDLSERYLFSAHMVQHILQTLVMPPLLLLGTPGWLLRPLLRFPPVMPVARLLTHPLVAFSLFNAIYLAWHLPTFYNAALLEHNVHILQHLLFISTAIITWWPILSPLRELPCLSHPAQMLYLFAQTVPQTLLGALLTFSNEAIYPYYAAAPPLWNTSPLLDQQVGGLIMKVAGLVVWLLALCLVFFAWFHREEVGAGNRPRPRSG